MPEINRAGVAQLGGLKKEASAKTEILRYPENLGNEENPHYVMFFANIPESRIEASRINEQDKVYYDSTSENRINENGINAYDSAGAMVGGLAGVTYGASAGMRAGETFLGRFTGAIGTAAFMGMAGAAVGWMAGKGLEKLGPFAEQHGVAGLAPNRLVHMPVAIALQITDRPSTAYHAEWADQEMGMLGNLAVGVSLGNAAQYGLRDALMGIASLPKLAGMGVDFKALTQKVERRVKNPQKEQLFKHMGFREFSYDYNFLPRSREEAESVFKIIHMFKQYMHPEMDSSKLFLKYPAEWNIVYYYKDRENEYLNKISTCALRDVKVSYGGNEFTTFMGTDGMPSEIHMQLQFVELEVLTSNRVGNTSLGSDEF
jgi:hypothetical protein